MSSRIKVILSLKTAHFDLLYKMPTKHTFLELCGKYLKSWYISGDFDVHFENLSGLWRLTEHLNGHSVESNRCLWRWRALFYFVMNRAMNFVGSIFKVIWLHIHSQGNASFTSVNADAPQSRKGSKIRLLLLFILAPAFRPNAECTRITNTPGPESLF